MPAGVLGQDVVQQLDQRAQRQSEEVGVLEQSVPNGAVELGLTVRLAVVRPPRLLADVPGERGANLLLVFR